MNKGNKGTLKLLYPGSSQHEILVTIRFLNTFSTAIKKQMPLKRSPIMQHLRVYKSAYVPSR